MMTTILSVKFGVCSQELIYSSVDLANVHLQSSIYFSRRIVFVYMMLVFGLDIRLALIISYGHATINVSSCSSVTNAMTVLQRFCLISVYLVFARDSVSCKRAYAIAIPSVCPSVCLSVTRVDQSKTVEVRIMQFSPYSSPIPLVFAH